MLGTASRTAVRNIMGISRVSALPSAGRRAPAPFASPRTTAVLPRVVDCRSYQSTVSEPAGRGRVHGTDTIDLRRTLLQMEKLMRGNRKYCLTIELVWATLAASCVTYAAHPPVKVLLLGKDRDHPYATHEYMAVSKLLAHCITQLPGVETAVSNGWPKQSEDLRDITAIVLYTCNGGDVLLAGPHRKNVEALLNNGVGLTAIHWGTGATMTVGDAWDQALGGWFCTDFSEYLVRTTRSQQDVLHPICYGWKDYDLRDEYYIKLKFQPEAKPVMKAIIDGEEHVLGWTYERTGAKRGQENCKVTN